MSRDIHFNFELFKRIVEAPGIPGREEPIRQVVTEAMRPLVDELRVDPLGNVIGTKRGSGGPRVMLSAHMDEIGFLVRHIDDHGFIRLQSVGGFDARQLPAQRVFVHTRDGRQLLGALQLGSKPIHTLRPDEIKAPTLSDLFVDLGLAAEAVKEQVEIGDMVTLARGCERVGESVMAKALDDRASVFIMLETLRAVGQHAAEIVAVASTEEEVGLRGAAVAAYTVEPDLGIALDVTIAGDFPGMPAEEQVTKLGHGVAIKIFDSSHIPNYKLVRFVREVAQRHEIPYQLEVLPRGGTDAGAIERTRGGVPVITISLPTRYLHTVNEMANVEDIRAEIRLLARLLEEVQRGDFSLG